MCLLLVGINPTQTYDTPHVKTARGLILLVWFYFFAVVWAFCTFFIAIFNYFLFGVVTSVCVTPFIYMVVVIFVVVVKHRFLAVLLYCCFLSLFCYC